MNQETDALIRQYAEGRSPQDAVESLAYLCRMLWLRRSDKLYGPNIPMLVDITNTALQNSDEFSHLPLLPNNEAAYRMNRGEIYFKDLNHRELEREVVKLLKDVLMLPEPKKPNALTKICQFFKQ